MPDTNAMPPPDCSVDLAHLLIRHEACDAFDPFMVTGHPDMPQRENRIVRACFYYALVVTPKITMLYDNCGRGGMCDMVPDEIRSVWRTPDLLAAIGTTFEEIKAGTAAIDLTVPPPPPVWTWDEKATEAEPETAPRGP